VETISVVSKIAALIMWHGLENDTLMSTLEGKSLRKHPGTKVLESCAAVPAIPTHTTSRQHVSSRLTLVVGGSRKMGQLIS